MFYFITTTMWAERWEERLAMVEADPAASASGGLGDTPVSAC